MAELNFSIGGVSVSVHSADADLLNELRAFNSNLTTVKKLLAHQTPHGGNLTKTAEAWGVKPDTIKKWVNRGLPVVKLDGMNNYYTFASIAKWLQENEIAIET